MVSVKLLRGDALQLLGGIEPGTVHLVFADPPYNLSGENHLTVKSGRTAVCDKGAWDRIDNIHEFNRKWLEQCKSVLHEEGTIWISGTLHNHPSVGVILKELGLWIINDVIWFKPNAPPLMQKNRFVPSTELIWVASKSKKYYFNYQMAKALGEGKQMRNLWTIPAQRHITAHPTEKPEMLLERIVLIGSKQGDTILDPFMGSGTTGAVAIRLNRNFIGIEVDDVYFQIAKKRIESTHTDGDVVKALEEMGSRQRPRLDFPPKGQQRGASIR